MIPPIATYRLQFRAGMTFAKAAGVVPYLKRLGVSHLYASPIFTATAGSTHGYDVTDCNEIDPAIGGSAGFERLSEVLRAAGLGLILDIVPNHMAASLENAWWRSVIEWGEQSPYARHFDIDWREPLTLPVLGQPFDEVLAAGELTLGLDSDHGCLALHYFDHAFPLNPSTYGAVIEALGIAGAPARALAEAAQAAAAEDPAPLRAAVGRFAAEAGGDEAVAVRLRALRGRNGFIKSLHARQCWRLMHWQEARRHLSYRRFFEITGLVGLRVEDEAVFDDVHRLVLDLVRSGSIDGLRIDHVDGLADPASYLRRLRAAVGPDVPIYVEKILEGDETLPESWPVQGTTGYEFIASMAALLTDTEQLPALDRAYVECCGSPDMETEKRAAKTEMLSHNFAGEVAALLALLADVAQQSEGQSPAPKALKEALEAVIVALPVYRTYGDARGLPPHDRRLVEKIVASVRRGKPRVSHAALDIIFAALTGDTAAEAVPTAAEFRRRFQQLTGPIMAKAVEDTAFYRYNRLIALNEVGGDPAGLNGGRAAFHHRMIERARRQPLSLSATATHDTKRGEDARARLYALSEAPALWADAVRRWRSMNGGFVGRVGGAPAPDPETEWLFYQALAGLWPEDLSPDDARRLASLRERFLPYVEKTLREAKRRTNWNAIDESYEAAVKAYAETLLSSENRDFLVDFAATLQPFIRAGTVNSLAQTLIKMTAPGIPDIYQGSEGVDLSLVDPDNRRPVDFEDLAQRLSQNAGLSSRGRAPQLSELKQPLIAACLRLRAAASDLFAQGGYAPLEAQGGMAHHVVAFARSDGDHMVVTVAPRLPLGLFSNDGNAGEVAWGDTTLTLTASAGLTDMFTGKTFPAGRPVDLANLLDALPVALLASFQLPGR